MDELTTDLPAQAIPEERAIPSWELEPAGLTDVARRRRDEIMDAAEAIIAGQGIDQLSLAKIEERAGMSRGQLTYYFPTRESILLAVHERMLRQMVREFSASVGPRPMTGKSWELFQHMLSVHLGLNPAHPLSQRKTIFSLLCTFLAQMGHREDYRNRLSEMSRTRQTRLAADFEQSVPEPRPLSPMLFASLFQSLIHGLTVQLMVDPDAFDRQAMFEACIRLFAPAFKEMTDASEWLSNPDHVAPARI